MSTYTIRHVEGRFQLTAGSVYKLEDLPKTAPEGTYYNTWQQEHPFAVFLNGKWEPRDTCPTEWRLLKTYNRLTKAPTNEWAEKNTTTLKDEAGNSWLMHANDEFCNNGGSIRDEYISSHNWRLKDDVPFNGRGLPDDMSAETREAMMYEDDDWQSRADENGNYKKVMKKRGYDYTWVTLSEWSQMYDYEVERLKNLITDYVIRKNSTLINKKLDMILSHLKDPSKLDTEEVNKLISKKRVLPEEPDENADYDESDEEPTEWDFDQDFREEYESLTISLFQIAEEFGRIYQIADQHDVYEGDVRCIYYLE